MIELLSPAGSPEALEAAVRSGADAVYFGLPDFNARRHAANFTENEFLSAVNYCHVRGIKTNITFNTLISDSEMEKAKRSIELIAASGADAVIVQDLGIADLIRRCCPAIDLHASTQMTVHSPSALDRLKAMGFSRVVLARELSEREIEEIVSAAEKIGMETEVFVHGAHCMCVSGQCYFSGMIGQRSGNRGMCAQPCRLSYDGGYPLSLKDMSLIEHVKRLEQLGVTSLKIEGRMKRPEYIAAATRVYYNAIRGSRDRELEHTLSKVFSRSGHTDGYFTSKLGAEMFGIRSKDDVMDTASVLRDIHAVYRHEMQRIKVDIKLAIEKDKPIEFFLSDGIHSVVAVGDIPQHAVSQAVTAQTAEDSASKLGGTPFLKNSFAARIDNHLFVSSKELNALRRDAVDKLMKMRNAKPKECHFDLPVIQERTPQKTKIYLRFSDVKQVPADLNGIDRLYVPLVGRLPKVPCELGVEIPRVLFEGEERIKQLLKSAKSNGAQYALCHNIAAVALAQSAGLKVHAGFGMNIYNSYSVEQMKDAVDITLSFELRLDAIVKLNRGGVIAYGKLPLMITRNCPKGGVKNCEKCDHTLTDRKGYQFPVICMPHYSEILNSKPLCLTQDIDGLDFAELYFTDESAEEIADIIGWYKDKKTLKGDYTRGLYYRGVY